MGTSGKKIGNVHLKWAFSESAVLFLRRNAEAVKYREKLARKHGKVKIPDHPDCRRRRGICSASWLSSLDKRLVQTLI